MSIIHTFFYKSICHAEPNRSIYSLCVSIGMKSFDKQDDRYAIYE